MNKGCDISGFSCTFSGFGNLSTLMLMSVERFFSVKYPAKMNRISPKTKICKLFSSYKCVSKYCCLANLA